MIDSNRLQRLQQTPLWDFACAFYAEDGVAAACLTLQDRAGVDVCELLFHGWLYRHRLAARQEPLDAERIIRQRWQQDVTQTLRALRRDLKAQAAQSASIHQLRETIKRAELTAEKENLDAWQAFALAPTAVDSRLYAIDQNAQFLSTWLKKKLFSRNLTQFGQMAADREQSVETAWRKIVDCLDPIRSSR